MDKRKREEKKVSKGPTKRFGADRTHLEYLMCPKTIRNRAEDPLLPAVP